MKSNYDFSKGVKNPYADKLKKGYSVTVHYDYAKQNDLAADKNAIVDATPRGEPAPIKEKP